MERDEFFFIYQSCSLLTTEFCSTDWEYFQGSCYFFSSTSKSWSDSQTHCQVSSSNLANIGSAPENDFINAHTNSKRWIGLREVPDNRMNWTDDSTEPVYVNWQTGEPVYQDDRDDCTYFSVTSGTWYTKSCDEVIQFVCEKGKKNGQKKVNEIKQNGFTVGGGGGGLSIGGT